MRILLTVLLSVMLVAGVCWATSYTTNYNFGLPADNSSTWGGEIRGNWVSNDTLIKYISSDVNTNETALTNRVSQDAVLQSLNIRGLYSLPIVDATSPGYLLSSDSAGNLTWGIVDVSGIGGANSTLSNLGTVAVNTDLISDTDEIDSLGSTGIRWNKVWALSADLAAQAQDQAAINISGGHIRNSNQAMYDGNPSIENVQLPLNAYTAISFDTAVTDIGTNYSGTTFTAPNAGVYFISAIVYLKEIDTAATLYEIRIATTGRNFQYECKPDIYAADSDDSFTVSCVRLLAAGNTIQVTVKQTAGTQQTDLQTGSRLTIAQLF